MNDIPRSQAVGVSDHSADYPTPKLAWTTVGILALTYLFSFMDRQILVLLIDPIKADLQITDTQVSLLTGFAFAIIYTTACVPLGRIADLWVRKYVIIAGVCVWSVLTMLCGLARSFPQLFLARMGVGFGEAALTPTAYAIIGDIFPPHKLARGMSVFAVSGLVGSGLSLLFGGAVIGLVEQMGSLALPLIGEVHSWQIVLLVVGGLSLLMVIPLSWMPEPKRHGEKHSEKNSAKQNATPKDELHWVSEKKLEAQKNLSFRGVLNYLWDHKTFYGFFIAAVTIANIAGYGMGAWIPSYFIRVHEWDASTTGITVGALYIVPAIIGGLASGWLADFLFSKGCRVAPLVIMFIAMLIIAPMIFIFIYAPVVQLKFPALVILYFVETMYSILFPTALLMATPHFIRAQVSALNLLVVNLVGIGFGPMAVALITDYVFQDDLAVGHSIAIVGVLAYGIGACILFFAIKPFRQRVMTVIAEGESEQSRQDSGKDISFQNKATA